MKNMNNPTCIRKNGPLSTALVGVTLLLTSLVSDAAINLDRTRIVFNDTDKSASIILVNQSTTSPYLAQSWIEDSAGQKVDSPLAALPPMQ
ncbi:molecular chaperone, partial [Yersinia massiliensis]|uniref:fimbrial biogenesis chaperone n=1 Tax=Yersinia massiliensis TaxID=419257 RepID=UPI00066FFF1D